MGKTTFNRNKDKKLNNTFSDFLLLIKNYLKNEFPQIDFDNDFEANNKLNALAWTICHRINNPDPEIKKQNQSINEVDEWRK